MASVTVLLTPDGPAAGVPDALADLSAAGLVRPYLWITESQLRGATVEATAVDGGRRYRVPFQRWIADTGRGTVDRVRIAVVVPLGRADPPLPADREQQLYQLVLAGGGGARITPVRFLVGRPGDVVPAATLARHGWHNVLVSPEDARGPDQPRVALPPSADAVEVGRFAGPVVAAVAGLWAGDDHAPLDDQPQPSQPRVRVARAFYRRVDGDAIERELRERVLSTEAPLPLPQDQMGPTEHVADPGRACAEMAHELWRRHRGALVGDRVAPERTPVVRTGALAAIRMLVSYLLSSLRTLPSDLVSGARNRTSAYAARRVHELVFGAGESAYAVVVNGIVDDLPASWRDVEHASGRLDERIAGTGPRPALRPDLRRLWDDYVAGALTLVDAGDRGMPPATAGANRAVLRSVADCAPAADQDFTDIPGHVAARTGIRAVQPGDVLEAESLQWKLEHLARDHGFGQDAGRVAAGLHEWAGRQAHTYSVQVGGHLAGALNDVVGEIRHHLAVLQQAAREPVEEQSDDRRRTLLGRILFGLGVAGLIAGPVLGVLGAVGTAGAVVIAALPILAWFGFVLANFLRARRETFRDLHRRRTLLNASDAARENLGRALVDLQRLAHAYDQYLVWSRVLGTVLRRPFGPPPPDRDAAAELARGLPLTTRVAGAGVDPRSMGAVASRLRADVFGRGWLGGPWQEQLLGAVGRLGRYDLEDRPGDITDLRGVPVHESALAHWSRLLVEQGTDPRVGDNVWGNVLRAVDGPRVGLAVELLSSVWEVGDDARPVDLATFLSRVDEPTAGPHDRFTPEMFTATALSQEHARIDVHDARVQRVGLGRVVTLVQMSEPWPPEEFTVAESDAPPAGHRPSIPVPAEPGPDPTAPSRPGYDPDGLDGPDPVRAPHVPPAPPGFA